jgi:predicted ATPase/DNA-binding SARP family transcriptional activator
MKMKRHLSLLLLGTFAAKLNEQPIIHFEYDKVRALLAYLAIEDRPHRRDALTGLLWPAQTDKKARHSLSQALLILRRALGDPKADVPFILADRNIVQFNPDANLWLDLLEFENALATCATHKHPYPETCTDCTTRRQQAVSYYRGEFLEGFSLGDSPAFDEWLVLKRERMHRLAIDALHHLTRYHEWRGELDEAREYGRRQVTLEPWREEAHRQLMRLLAHSGQRSAALNQYEICRRILAEELGVEPSAETNQLYKRIRAAGSSPRHNLPLQSTPFVGRQQEVAELNGTLAHPDCRLLTVVGAGGMGKTRLALQVAERKKEAFLDGVYFVPLAALETADWLVTAVANALKFRFTDQGNSTTQLIDYLRGKEMLLLLDNFEHLPAGAGFVTDILEQAPGVKLLITSRARLNLSWEIVYQLGGLPVSDSKQADVMEMPGAVCLFVQSAQRAHREFEFRSQVASHIQRVCQLVEGMPLAIELAASWVRVMSCGDIVAEIERGLDFLETTAGDILPRHSSIRAVFDHSWQLLSSHEQKVLCRLSVFRGGFSREAAIGVAGASLPDLASLVDKSLLRRDANGRYDVHELLRQYAAEKQAAQVEETYQVRDDHSRYFAGFLERQASDLSGAHQMKSLAKMAQEVDNVQAAWNWLLQQSNHPLIEKCLEPLFQFYERKSWLAEGRRAFATAVNSLAQSEQLIDKELLLARLATRLARFQSHQSDFEQAKKRLDESIPVLRRQAGSADLALALRFLGDVQASLGRYETAVSHFQESLDIYKRIGDQSGIAITLNRLGATLHNLGQFVAAKQKYEESLSISTSVQDSLTEGASWHGLGHIASDLGETGEAETCFQKSLEIARESGSQWRIASTLNILGNVHYAKGNYNEAERCYRQSLTIRQDLGARSGIAAASNNLGIVAFARGEYSEAGERYRESLAIARKIKNKRAIAIALNNLGELALAGGEHQAALTHYQESLAISQEIGQMRGVIYSLNFLGSVSLALEAVNDAMDYFCRALQLAWERQTIPRFLDALLGLAHVEYRNNNSSEALKLLELVLQHPSTEKPTLSKAQHFKDELASRLPSDTASVMESETATDLQETIKQWLERCP